MKKVLFFLLLAIIPLTLRAQTTPQDSTKLKADLSITGVWQAGNVQTWIFRGKSEVIYNPSSMWEFKARNSYVYQEFGRVKADQDILSLNFLSYNTKARVYPLLLGFVSTNFRRKIDVRYLVGAGSTFKVIDSKKVKLTFSATGEYEETDYNTSTFNRSEYDGDSSIDTFRGTIWINGRYELFQNKVILKHESFYQQSFEQANNFRWQTDVAVELPVSKYLNFRINFLETYESIVVEDQLRGDEFMTFGFTVKSY